MNFHPGRCTAIYPGTYPEGAQCERWAEHELPHAINSWTGAATIWNDCVPCKHCGEPIYEGMIPGRFMHFRSGKVECDLKAEAADPDYGGGHVTERGPAEKRAAQGETIEGPVSGSRRRR